MWHRNYGKYHQNCMTATSQRIAVAFMCCGRDDPLVVKVAFKCFCACVENKETNALANNVDVSTSSK